MNNTLNRILAECKKGLRGWGYNQFYPLFPLFTSSPLSLVSVCLAPLRSPLFVQ